MLKKHLLAGCACALIATAFSGMTNTVVADADTPEDLDSAILVGSVARGGDGVADAAIRVSLFPITPNEGFEPGTEIEVLDLPVALTGDDGSYLVEVPANQSLDNYVDQWGRTDLSLSIESSGDIAYYRQSTMTPDDLSARLGQARGTQFSARSQVPAVSLDFDSGVLTEDLGDEGDLTESPMVDIESVSAGEETALARRDADADAEGEDCIDGSDGDEPTDMPTRAGPGMAPTDEPTEDAVGCDDDSLGRHACRVTAKEQVIGKYERFGFIDNYASAPATILQAAGNERELGIAVRFSGKSWGVSAGATKKVASNNSASQSGVVQKWARNRVNYQVYEYKGLCEGGGEREEAVPTGTHSLLVPAVSTPGWNGFNKAGCQLQDKGYTITKGATTNVAVSGGVDLGPVDVSAKEGWTRTTQYSITLKKNSTECWSNTAGPNNSAYLSYRGMRTEPCGRAGTEVVDEDAGEDRCRGTDDDGTDDGM